MSKDFDTSWFDLKNYDKLKELDLQGWITQIALRNLVYKFDDAAQNYKEVIKNNPVYIPIAMTWEDAFAAKRYAKALEVDPNAIDTYEKDTSRTIDLNDWRNNGSNLPFNTYSVRGTPLSSHLHLANDSRLNLDCIYDESKTGFTADMIYKEQHIDMLGDNVTHVTVDLAANDRQIMRDFSYWLTEYRKITGNEETQKNVTQSNFKRWIKNGVIPYLDLKLISKLEDKKITASKLAYLIFPDEYEIGITGRITDTTKPEAMRLIEDYVIAGLRAQL